jgi:CelD/BcsL family acetyltransferase involved in cellulose biosynthesis
MTIEFLAASAVPADSALARFWEDKLRSERNLYAMYQARSWVECTAGAAIAPTQVAVIRDAPAAEPRALAPIGFETVPLRFRLSRREFGTAQLHCAELLAGRALGELDHAGYSALVAQIFARHPDIDAVYLKSLPDDSSLWKMLDDHGWRLGAARAYRPDGTRPFHHVEFTSTFDAYMGEFRKKQRYNLKRQVRLMTEGLDNSLQMRCIDKPEEIDEFLAAVRTITAKSWKAQELEQAEPEMAATPEVLKAIAAAGLLRAYLLTGKGQPAAYALGYRFNGIYHYANVGYDAELASYSPGAVLLLLMLEDLADKAGVKFVNFGITDAGYKRVFGNRHLNDASVIVMRPTWRNGVLLAAHRLFEGGKNLLRRMTRKAPPPPATEKKDE